jgi:hypothetical protein
MDLGAGSGAAFGRQNVAARRSPLDHQNGIKLVLRAKQNKLCAGGIGIDAIRPKRPLCHVIEASLDLYYAQVLLDVSARAH